MQPTNRDHSMVFPLSNRFNATAPHLRYGFKPQRGSSHHWAISQLSEGVYRKSVLDVGPGSGWLGEALKHQEPNSLVTIEIDLRAHEHLKTHYHEVHSDLTGVRGRRFDIITALDLLEHLPEPAEFLHELGGLLAPGGCILLSVPNIAHWSVRLPLFFWGSFRYTEKGILDRSHLHFFSRSSFRELCCSVPNSKLAELSASIEPAELALPSWVSQIVLFRWSLSGRHWLAQRMPGLLGYQHLARIESTLK